MPIEGRRVRHDAQRIGVNFEFARRYIREPRCCRWRRSRCNGQAARSPCPSARPRPHARSWRRRRLPSRPSMCRAGKRRVPTEPEPCRNLRPSLPDTWRSRENKTAPHESPFSLRPSTVTGKSNALVPTNPYLVFQRSPGLSPGAVPTNSLPLGTTMMFDLRSMANSSVRAKMIEPSLGLIVMPVQAGAVDGPIGY